MTTAYDVENTGHGLWRNKYVAGVNRLLGSKPSPLDNCISNSILSTVIMQYYSCTKTSTTWEIISIICYLFSKSEKTLFDNYQLFPPIAWLCSNYLQVCSILIKLTSITIWLTTLLLQDGKNTSANSITNLWFSQYQMADFKSVNQRALFFDCNYMVTNAWSKWIGRRCRFGNKSLNMFSYISYNKVSHNQYMLLPLYN